MVTTTSTKIELQAECMDGKFGYSTLPQLAYWNCTCAAVRGSPLLLALLAAAVAAGWITALRGSHHLGDEWVGLFVAQDPRHFARECCRIIN